MNCNRASKSFLLKVWRYSAVNKCNWNQQSAGTVGRALQSRGLLNSRQVFWGSREHMDNNSEHVTRVLFCGPHFAASHTYTREYLQSFPFIQVDDVPFNEIPSVIGNYDICVVKSMRLGAELISHAKKMKLIMQYGVGLEGVDIDAASKHGIKVGRIPSGGTGNAASCAEMAIYLMLGLLRKQNEIPVAIKHKKLGEPIGDTLLGKTLEKSKMDGSLAKALISWCDRTTSCEIYLKDSSGCFRSWMENIRRALHDTKFLSVFILGFGNIGIHLARRLRPFGVKILATKRSWTSHVKNSSNSEESDHDLVDETGSHQDILNFASKSDIIVCCLVMNTETAGIVNDAFLSSMRKGAMLINIARGGLLDYDAVLHHLKSGHLGALGIDVAWTEPFDPDDAILKFPNVTITPHIAGVTKPSYRYMAKITGDVALQLHAGTPLTGIEIVN